MHMNEAKARYFPKNLLFEKLVEGQENKLKSTGIGETVVSVFLLPVVLPQIDLWYTSVIKWNSYVSEEAIAKDIREYGLQWIIQRQDNTLKFMTPEEFSRIAVTWERHPKVITYPYNLPPEIIATGY